MPGVTAAKAKEDDQHMTGNETVSNDTEMRIASGDDKSTRNANDADRRKRRQQLMLTRTRETS